MPVWTDMIHHTDTRYARVLVPYRSFADMGLDTGTKNLGHRGRAKIAKHRAKAIDTQAKAAEKGASATTRVVKKYRD